MANLLLQIFIIRHLNYCDWIEWSYTALLYPAIPAKKLSSHDIKLMSFNKLELGGQDNVRYRFLQHMLFAPIPDGQCLQEFV